MRMDNLAKLCAVVRVEPHVGDTYIVTRVTSLRIATCMFVFEWSRWSVTCPM